MKKLMLFAILAIALASCGKVPTEKYLLTKHCVDSLKQAGAETSLKFVALQDTLKDIEARLENQNSKLFKKYSDIKMSMDYVINESRSFVMSYDKLDIPKKVISDINYVNSNTIKLVVEITFDTPQNALNVASQVDEAVRRSINLNAKLISVKIWD